MNKIPRPFRIALVVRVPRHEPKRPRRGVLLRAGRAEGHPAWHVIVSLVMLLLVVATSGDCELPPVRGVSSARPAPVDRDRRAPARRTTPPAGSCPPRGGSKRAR
jgi:hypothetical protein